MDTKALGRRIEALRAERGWSREEAAEKAKLHPNTIRNIELGADSMQLRTLSSLARVYGVSVHDLIEAGERPSRRLPKAAS